MKRLRIFPYIISILLLTACSGTDYERLLQRFEEMNRTDVPLSPDSVLPLVRHYDHWWHSRNHRMRAYYMLGCAYRDQGSVPRALENYQRAVSIADTTDARCDLNTLMRVHSQMARIFLQQRLPEQEEQELQTAEHLAWQIGDTLSALIFEEKLIYILYRKDKHEECINKTLNLCKKYQQYGYNDEALLTYSLCIGSSLILKDYINAKIYLDRYEKCPFFKDSTPRVDGGLGALYILKGQYFIGIEEIDSAEIYFHRAIPFIELGNNEILTYKGLYQTYRTKNDADSVLKFTQLYSEAKERNFDKARAEALTQAKAMYDYSTEKKLTEKKQQEISWLVQALITSLLIVILIIIYTRYRNEKKKREIVELKQKYEKANSDLQRIEEAIMSLETEKGTKDNRIDAFVEKANQLKAEVVFYRKAFKKIDNRENDANLVETKIVKRFKYSLTHFSEKDKLQDAHWQELRETVESVYPSLYKILNARQELQEHEYRICLLIKAGFKPFEIDIIMNREHSYASNTRKRLHKKVFGIEGSGAKFDQKVRDI